MLSFTLMKVATMLGSFTEAEVDSYLFELFTLVDVVQHWFGVGLEYGLDWSWVGFRES
jgi:hypothetical protein